MYHYAGNNPVKYTDPDGKFDFDNFYKGIVKLFTNKRDFQKKFAEFDEFTYDQNTYQPEAGDFYGIYNDHISVVRKTEYGKLSNIEKLQVLENEWNNLTHAFESNKTEGVDSLKNLFYGLGESLFSSGSYTSLDEFCINFFGNNLENICDIAQFDLDGINLLIQRQIVEQEINKVHEDYINE